MRQPPDPRRAAAPDIAVEGGDKITGEGDRHQATTVVEVADLTVDEARALVGRIRQTGALLWQQLVKAYRGRAWIALGYSSWDELCDTEFRDFQLRLPREERRDVVASLRESGMSTRAIASATGASRTTIKDDLRQVDQSDPPDGDDEVVVDAEVLDDTPLAPVIGLDGKRYKKPSVGNRRKHDGQLDALINQLSGAAMAFDGVTELDRSITKEEAARLMGDLSTQIRSLNRILNLVIKRTLAEVTS